MRDRYTRILLRVKPSVTYGHIGHIQLKQIDKEKVMVTTTVTNEKATVTLKQKDKWCPMARLLVMPRSEMGTSANRFYGGDDGWMCVRCLGEACAVYVGSDANGYCGLINP
jgi:hypothetical protein